MAEALGRWLAGTAEDRASEGRVDAVVEGGAARSCDRWTARNPYVRSSVADQKVIPAKAQC
jgi:hypothetical protein